LLTHAEAAAWQEAHTTDPRHAERQADQYVPQSGLQSGAGSLHKVRSYQRLAADIPCAIVAFDKSQLVGHLRLVYANLLVNDRLQPCAVGEDLFVLEEYRNRAVGISIVLKALKLGMPYIEAGVSGQMAKILGSWKQFTRVDASPIFQAALDRAGLRQMAKWNYYELPPPVNRWASSLAKLGVVRRLWSQQRELAKSRRRQFAILSPATAIERLARCLVRPGAPVCLPWNENILRLALTGTDKVRGAWILDSTHDNRNGSLMTTYLQRRVLGSRPDGSPNCLMEGHLTEVYPPVGDAALARALLGMASDKARAMGANVLQVHATTPALEQVCREFGLVSRMKKSIYVAASGVDAQTKSILNNPENWWCRAFNENQFAETFVPDGGLDATARSSNFLRPTTTVPVR
jgi:hypothetical protein